MLLLVASAVALMLCPSTVSAQQANQTTVPQFRVISRFDPISGALFYDKVDRNGFTVQRVTNYFSIPPVANCNLTLWSNVLQSLAAESIQAPVGVGLNATDPIQCCDYFSPRVGYEFTQCERNIGPYIFDNRKNSPLSL
jgi:hypothetical protein